MFVRDPLVSHIQNNNTVIRDVLQVQEFCGSWGDRLMVRIHQ